MAVVSNKGVPSHPLPEHLCGRCKTRLVRMWNGKHLAMCSLEELEEAIKHLEKTKSEWKDRLDPSCMTELCQLAQLRRGIYDKYQPETAQFAIKEDCILYIFNGVRGFVSKDEIPEGSTKLFLEYKTQATYPTEGAVSSIRWFTDKTDVDAVRPWRVVGELGLTNETFKLVRVAQAAGTPENN